MLYELPFHGKLNVVKTTKAFKGYACSYSVEVIDSKDSSLQLTISKPSSKDLFKDFKYQKTLKVFLRKNKGKRICSCLF